MYTTRNPKNDKEEDREEINFFYNKVITLCWDLDWWRWGHGGHFLNYTTKSGREIIASRNSGTIRAGDKWEDYLPVTIDSFGFKYGTLFAPAKNERLFGPFGTRRLRSTSGEHVLHLSPNNVCFASPIQVNPLNTSFRIAFKLGGLDVGQHLSCINHVEFVRAIMIFLIGNKPSLGKKILRNTVRKSKFGTILEVLPFGPFGWNVMTKCSITNNDMKRG